MPLVLSTPHVIDQNRLCLNNPELSSEADIRGIVSYSNHCLALHQDGTISAWGCGGR